MHKKYLRAVDLAAVLLAVIAPILLIYQANAAPLTTRSVTVTSSLPSAVTTHRFEFTYSSITNVGSVEFEYCTNTPFVDTACSAPAGMDASGATLAAETGETGFTIDAANTTANKIVLTRGSAPVAAVPSSYTFDNVQNHSAANFPSYVRISTYASIDATGAYTDEGAVAYSTASAVLVSGYVPPYITFCVGVTVALNCSSANGSLLNFGEFATNQPKAVSSQFSVATNDPAGYTTMVTGTTMTSGNNTIAALNTVPRPSQPGTSQFGINLRANSNPAIGADPVGVGSGAIMPNFSNPNQFFFDEQILAYSSLSSDFNVFTVSYMVNVSADQRPGIYVTTLTYIATAAF